MRKISDETIVRLYAGDDANHPVEIKRGSQPAKYAGRGWHYTTRTGIEISHPSAYASKGWSSMVYHPSTLRLVAGAAWVRAMRRTMQEIDGTRVAGDPAEIHGVRVYRTLRKGGTGSLVVGLGRTYHTGVTVPRLAVESALRAWHTQRATDRQERAEMEGLILTQIWVSAEDSIRAGNCQSETERERVRLEKHNLGDAERRDEQRHLVAVRADALLAHRYDAYTRRAVVAASMA